MKPTNFAKRLKLSRSTVKTITPFQVTGLAIEFSRQPDGTISLNEFEANCERAFAILTKFQAKLDSIQTNEDEPS
jgi:hypothetical protein